VRRVPAPGSIEGDEFRWKWTSAYRVLFHGRTVLLGAANVWNAFAPLKFKLHAWLALCRWCWTADRRQRRGLRTHIVCPLCGSQEETIDHISLQCHYAMAVWMGAITHLGLPNILPSQQAQLGEWWPEAVARFWAVDRKVANSLIMLVMRALWLERNARVFNRESTSAQTLLRLVLDNWNA
jgi:hypothetical protein